MKFINKIEIQYFRSLKNEKIKDTNELNIFSGKINYKYVLSNGNSKEVLIIAK